MTEKATYRILPCWRCRGVKVPERDGGYWCPACGMPLATEDLFAAWSRAGDSEALPLTADTWEEFLRCHGLHGDDVLQLQKREPNVRALSWRTVSLRELREYVDQGAPISWLPGIDPAAPEEEEGR